MVASWPGSASDYEALKRAISRYCTCEFDQLPFCPPHAMLTDQEALNRLADLAFRRAKLIDEESLIK